LLHYYKINNITTFAQVHSTTGEIPDERFYSAMEKRSPFRTFEILKPFVSTRDIFTLRADRM